MTWLEERVRAGGASARREDEIRTLDALHLASALVLPRDGLIVAVWHAQLHRRVRPEGARAALAEDLDVRRLQNR